MHTEVEAIERVAAPVEADAPFIKKLGTAALLSGVAVASLAAEASGLNHDLPTVARLAVDSGGHPVLGYVGVWVGTSFFRRSRERVRTMAGFVGATLADFATETVQSMTIAAPQYADFMSSRNLPETAKDYAFALAGLGWYLFQNRRREG